mgnify:CR=1 FL=1
MDTTNQVCTVLCLDDDSVFTDVICHRLGRDGISNAYAPTWSVAQQMLSKEPLPKVILLDVSMPDINGFEVLQKLKGDTRTAHIPVLMFSNNVEPENFTRSKALGAREYLIKVDISPGEVAEKIKQILAETTETIA